jgi:Leucine-rich repeat (LRR) protein|tara:strand:+ start:3123 stop:4508 length:1386 start_codon:yes stop_codon:yes gene_type:complete
MRALRNAGLGVPSLDFARLPPQEEFDVSDLYGETGALTERTLMRVTGSDDLSVVTYAEMKVDTLERSVSMLGELLPALREVRLSDSSVMTLRDLGTTLRNLRVLWLCRSSVRDLEGASALPQLEELYLSFNDVSDLTPLALHEHLRLLDLDSNQIDDVAQIEQLGTCERLTSLNLESNPVSSVPRFRRLVCHLVPTLEQLDDMPIVQEDRGADSASIQAAWRAARAQREGCSPHRVGSAPPAGAGAGPRGEERQRICALGLADVYDHAVGSSGSPQRPVSDSSSAAAVTSMDASPAAAAAAENETLHLAASVKASLRSNVVERIGTPRGRRGSRSGEYDGGGAGATKSAWSSWIAESSADGAVADVGGDDSSSLTHGSDVVFAGNAVLAMRRRRGTTPKRAGGGATGSSVEGDDEMTRAMDHLRRCAAASKPASPLGALRPLRTKASLQPTRLYNGGACVN